MNETLFNQWASEYERDIVNSDGSYPFAGYFLVVEKVREILQSTDVGSILDIGVGSGFMLDKLMEGGGFRYFGVDFSEGMLKIAKSRFDENKMLKHDISEGVPVMLQQQKFDAIISAYTLHHFPDEKKIEIIDSYSKLLSSPKGVFIIADISFEDENQLEKVKREAAEDWDEEEESGYLIADAFLPKLRSNNWWCAYESVSFCSGIYVISFD